MCLIVFAWQAHPDFSLVLGANRDEFHERPAAPLDWWTDEPDVVGGRDLEAGGTWLALTRSGRFATVTNYREDLRPQPGIRSRGELVTRFLTGCDTALGYASALDDESYAGFSLLAGTLGERDELVYVSNRGDAPRALAPGVYGLSNASLDTSWPKVLRSKARLASLLGEEVGADAMFAMLADREPGRSDDIADAIADDLPEPTVRAIAAPFVVTPAYGTRCSTVVLVRESGEAIVHERRFDSAGAAMGDTRLNFHLARQERASRAMPRSRHRR